MVNRPALVLSLALGVAPFAAMLVVAPDAANAQEAKKEAQRVGAKVGKPLKAAQDAMKKEDWDTALAKTLEADALPDKTAYESYQIDEFLGFIYLRKADYANAAVAYDELLKSGLVPPEDLPDRIRVATQLNFQIKNYPQAIEYGKRWVEASGATDAEPHSLIAQAYFIEDDYANALTHARSAIEIARGKGEPVKEAWLQIALACYNNNDDMVNVSAVLQELVREFPGQKYWNQLLGVTQRVEEQDDRVTLSLYELMFELGSLQRDVDFVEMAQLAIEAGVPGEAVKVLEKGFETKILEEEDVPRRRALLEEARASAQNDQKSLAGLEAEAKSAATGQADVALGSAFLSYDQYDKAVEALRRGIAKGGAKRPDEAQIALGRALLKVSQPEEALKAFAAVPDSSKFARIANLWEIYATGPRPLPR
jgi:tetratricopeptide (TPR) repeat protein